MYHWIAIRVKTRLGIPLSDANLDYAVIQQIKQGVDVSDVEVSENSVTFIYSQHRRVYCRRFPHSDLMVAKQVLRDREYEDVVRVFKEIFCDQSRAKIIDAGANVGFTSAYFLSQLANPQIACIEPGPANLEMLRQNLNSEVLNGDVFVFPNALMHKGGMNITLENGFRDGRDWALSTRESESESESEIKSLSISDVMTQMHWNQVDIVKIDIEGAERFVFGGDAALDWLGRAKVVAIEIHDEFGVREDIQKIFAKWGFSVYDSGETTVAVNQKLITSGAAFEDK